ncbi:MAG TPA: hypothetical protein VGL02_24780 [Streptomyces sp.]
MTVTEQQPHQPAAPGRFLAGYGAGVVHALDPRRAAQACDRMRCAGSLVVAVCGDPADLMPRWGEFAHDNPLVTARGGLRRCPHCAWALALDQRTEAAELAKLTPAGTDLQVLSRLLPDPLLVVTICEAILDSADDEGWDRGHPHILQLLAKATEHAPEILLPEECSVDGCDHDRPGRPLLCGGEDARLGCPMCSVRAGSWAGDGEGIYADECDVPVPCQVLRTLAAYYRIAVGGQQPQLSPAPHRPVPPCPEAPRTAREDA